MSSLNIIQTIIAANSLGFALFLLVLRATGRPVNVAVPGLFIAVGLMAAMNLLPDQLGQSDFATGFRWGLPLCFGPLALLYVWTAAGRRPPGADFVSLHAAPPVLLTLLFSTGRAPAWMVSAVILSSIGGYMLTIACLRLTGPARIRALGLSLLGGTIVVLNILLQAAEAWRPEIAPSLKLAIFLLLLTLVGYFLAAGLTDPEALFRAVARPMGLAPPSPLAQADAEFILARVERLIEDETPYFDPAFQLSHLARRLGLPARQVSRAINQVAGISVPDYLNRARVRAVERRLLDAGETANILDLALDCGFNSKATFYRAFARHAGVAPRDARRTVSGSDENKSSQIAF